MLMVGCQFLNMEESHRLDNLLSARVILKSSIEKSRNIAVAVDETGSRLKQRSHNLANLQGAVRNMASKWAVYEIRGHVDRAIPPASAVLKVCSLVYELQDSLEADSGIFTRLTSIRRLQEALKLLADNCRLVTLWLEDVMQILKNSVATSDDSDDWYAVRVSRILNILMELQLFCQDGGVLSSEFDSLEIEYRSLLTETGFDSDSSFRAPVIQELQAITEVLAANNRLDRCMSIYAEVRIAEIRATLQAMNVEYLGLQLSEMDSVQNVETYIYQWDKHMAFAVRNLLQIEYKLCSEVYRKAGKDVWMDCFAKIATECGFIDIFKFGSSVCNCKKEAMKLLSLLKIVSTLDKLTLQFNELFSGKSQFSVRIQNQTRGLVKRVVDGACEIFWELLKQVELQRASDPPPDGDIPRLVHFITEYCDQLLEDESSSILNTVLQISQMWNKSSYEDGGFLYL